MTEYEFEEWFKNTNLGLLEDVREVVLMQANQNASETDYEQDGDDAPSFWEMVKATVEEYADAHQNDPDWDLYRR
jgi:hypothetical protein